MSGRLFLDYHKRTSERPMQGPSVGVVICVKNLEDNADDAGLRKIFETSVGANVSSAKVTADE